MSLPWRLKGLATQAQSLGHRFTSIDGFMILTAFADLRIRGPEVQSVCFKCCVALASARGDRALKPYMAVEALAALASLQARRILLIRRALAPRLLELASNTSPKTLQRAALALVKLGQDAVPAPVAAHVLALLLEAILHNRVDDALVVGACALLSLSVQRNKQDALSAEGSATEDAVEVAVEDGTETTTSDLVAACIDSSQDACVHNLLARKQGDGWTITQGTATIVGLWLARESVRRGIPTRATGNATFQLLHLLPTLATVHVALTKRQQLAHLAWPSFEAQRSSGHHNSSSTDAAVAQTDVVLRNARETIVAFVSALNLKACVPGGFAGFAQCHLQGLVPLLPLSMPFVRRLLLAASDRLFSKAFNAYDVAKLADAVRVAPWEPLWLSLPAASPTDSSMPSAVTATASGGGSTSNSASPPPAGRLADLLVAVAERLVVHVEFFARHALSASPPSGGAMGARHQKQRLQLDGVVFCSVLRCLLRLATIPGTSLGRRGSDEAAFVGALEGMMARACVAFVVQVDDVADRWAAESIPLALATVSRVLTHFSKRTTLPPNESAHDHRQGHAKTVAVAALRLARGLTDHHRPHSLRQTMTTRESVQALYCAASVHTALKLMSAKPDAGGSASTMAYGDAEVAVLWTLCRTSLANGTWCDAVAADWTALPRSEWAMLVRALGGGLGPLVAAAPTPVGGAARSSMAAQVGRLATSFLQHAAKADTPPSDHGHAAQGSDSSNNALQQIDALVAALGWLGSDAAALDGGAAASAVRVMFRKLRTLPEHSLPSSAIVQLLDALVANRRVVFSVDSAAATGPTARGGSAAAVLLRSDVKVLWLQQRHTHDWQCSRGSGGGGGGLSRHGVVMLCRAAVCLRILGFTLVPEEAWDDPTTTSSEYLLPQQQHRSSSSLRHAAEEADKATDKRRLPLPLPQLRITATASSSRSIGARIAASNSNPANTNQASLGVADAVQLSVLVDDQWDRLLQRDRDAWSRAVAPHVSCCVAQVSMQEAISLVQALRVPTVQMLLLPRLVDRQVLLDRCGRFASGTGDPQEVADLLQAFREAPHLLERLPDDALLHRLVFP